MKEQKGRSLVLFFIGIALAVLLMSLPLYHFQANIFTKKSSNTFYGDEKYQEVRKEVEEIAEEYRAQGLDVEIAESFTERTNSKGETTSLAALSIQQSYGKSAFSFLGAGFSSSCVLLAIVICTVLAVICAVAGCTGPPCEDMRLLSTPKKRLRFGAMFFTMADVVLVPVFLLMNRYLFWRKLSLYKEELITDGKEDFYGKIDRFLFSGKMGEEIGDAVKDLAMDHSPLLWVLILCFVISFAAAIQIRHGTVKNTFARVILYLFVIVVCVVTLYPYYVMLITAFRSNAETLDMYFLHLVPTKWEWGNLSVILGRGVPRFLLNSLLVAGGATLLAMLCGIPAAFAMARMNFKGKKFFLGFVIMSQMFSPVVLLIGISQLMNTIHLNDTILGLVFVNAAFNQAFAVWLLRGTFVAISPEMEQAAKIDGCGTMGSLIKILLPMAAPGIVTTLIFVFINAWNEYTISTVLISTSTNRPITVGITQFSSFNMIEWQYLFAASLIATIPVVILFMTIEKHLTSGLTSGGVKG